MRATQFPSTPLIDTDDDVLPSEVDVLCAGDRPAEPVEWLWPGRIPIGKVTLLVGDPGLGKSLVALDVAARVSRGTDWPDDTNCGLRNADCGLNQPIPQPEIRNLKSALPGSVLILSAEDDLADTIRSRLDAARADPERVFVLPSLVDLRNEFAELRAAVDRLPDCRLIVIDPINAYVGPADSHFHTVVRRVLAPLARLATEKRIAVLAVAHLRKSDGAAIRRAAGSMGFVAAARAVWTVCRDPSIPDRHLFLPLKNNLAAPACGLAYTIEPRGPLAAPAVVWDPAPVSAPTAAPGPRAQPSAERAEARQWLREALAGGPRPARAVIDEGEQRGFLRRTLQRAFHELEGHTAKRGLLEGWWWSLADQSAADDAEEGAGPPDIFEDVTAERDIFGEFESDHPFGGLDLPSVAQSIAAIERLDRRRREKRRRSDGDPASQRPPPANTVRSIVDQILQSFGDASPAKVQCPHQVVPDTS